MIRLIKNLIEIPIPTATSFVQFLTSDNKDNVWFVEQQGNKLGMIKITEIPMQLLNYHLEMVLN